MVQSLTESLAPSAYEEAEARQLRNFLADEQRRTQHNSTLARTEEAQQEDEDEDFRNLLAATRQEKRINVLPAEVRRGSNHTAHQALMDEASRHTARRSECGLTAKDVLLGS